MPVIFSSSNSPATFEYSFFGCGSGKYARAATQNTLMVLIKRLRWGKMPGYLEQSARPQ